VRVERFTNWDDLLPYREAWDRLAGGVVFRSWSWTSAWWRHYGLSRTDRTLEVLVAFRDAADAPAGIVAILPAYSEPSWIQGRALRLLGDGEICSDHTGLLCESTIGLDGASAIARSLAQDASLDVIELAAVDEGDLPTARLFEDLGTCGLSVSRVPGDRIWAIDLPPTWEEFLALQSKSHRKQLRQMERRVLAAADTEWRLVGSTAEFGDAWQTLVDLHQRRRQSLGEPGCFASPTWAAFHWEVAQELLRKGELRLSTLRLGGSPIAAEYHFAGTDVTWAYQGGLEPCRLADEPGQLSTLCSIRRAIEEGHHRFDFLRGDEPYKAHWRAVPLQTYRLTAVPDRLAPRLRRGAYVAARQLGAATRELTGLFS
jgi:CelD/BcsL family acetyltransferase involved in cellulose biosynthesis